MRRAAGRRLLVCALHITRCKFVQTVPNKTKRKRLDFLGFLWPILDFSKGYGESKQFFPFSTSPVPVCARGLAHSPVGAVDRRHRTHSRERHDTLDFGFREEIVGKSCTASKRAVDTDASPSKIAS
jgi:hypothetical protein